MIKMIVKFPIKKVNQKANRERAEYNLKEAIGMHILVREDLYKINKELDETISYYNHTYAWNIIKRVYYFLYVKKLRRKREKLFAHDAQLNYIEESLREMLFHDNYD